MKALFLCGVAVLGLSLLPGAGSAAPLSGAASQALSPHGIERPLLLFVQARSDRPGGGSHGGGSRQAGGVSHHGGGGHYRGGHYHGGGGDGSGAAAGAAIGLFLGAMMAVEAQRQQAIQYCMHRFRSYDPSSMTYVGRNGRRYRCP